MKISQDKKVFITGCGGMLGKTVYEEFAPQCQILATDIDLNESWLDFVTLLIFKKYQKKLLSLNQT